MTTPNELPSPDLSEEDIRQLLSDSMAIVSAVPESATTNLVARLLEIVVAQRLMIIELTNKAAPVVADHLKDAFLEGFEASRDRNR